VERVASLWDSSPHFAEYTEEFLYYAANCAINAANFLKFATLIAFFTAKFGLQAVYGRDLASKYSQFISQPARHAA
jgi:hypothetical protein